MKIEDIKNNYYFKTLSEKDDLSDFDCGDDDLNDFIKNDALLQQNEKLNVTKLIKCDEKIIGFITLLTDTINLKKINDKEIKLNLKKALNLPKKSNPEISSVKIGRLAIDEKYLNKGIGTHILRNIIYSLKIISEIDIGFRFIIVEGYAKAFNFYVVRNGFEYLKKDKEKIEKINFITQRDPKKRFFLYFDLKKIKI